MPLSSTIDIKTTRMNPKPPEYLHQDSHVDACDRPNCRSSIVMIRPSLPPSSDFSVLLSPTPLSSFFAESPSPPSSPLCSSWTELRMASTASASNRSSGRQSTRSRQLPEKTHRPAATMTISSTLFRKCEAWVTRTTARSEKRPSRPVPTGRKSRSNTARDVPASSADRTSSSTTTSDREYAARARLRRAFCPPDRVTPRSPISVRSPCLKLATSDARHVASSTRAYRSASRGSPNKMLSRTVALRTNGTWEANETLPPT
mmetsp:Transcript_7147/g.16593  ORF Transcript_7147/g.16593 Transcript_7147/m.16593 type:complete len:260 (+) Transcript_7147:1756-2535(+)